jgi:hypothetical protein
MYRMELALIIVMGVNDLHARFILKHLVPNAIVKHFSTFIDVFALL